MSQTHPAADRVVERLAVFERTLAQTQAEFACLKTSVMEALAELTAEPLASTKQAQVSLGKTRRASKGRVPGKSCDLDTTHSPPDDTKQKEAKEQSMEHEDVEQHDVENNQQVGTTGKTQSLVVSTTKEPLHPADKPNDSKTNAMKAGARKKTQTKAKTKTRKTRKQDKPERQEASPTTTQQSCDQHSNVDGHDMQASDKKEEEPQRTQDERTHDIHEQAQAPKEEKQPVRAKARPARRKDAFMPPSQQTTQPNDTARKANQEDKPPADCGDSPIAKAIRKAQHQPPPDGPGFKPKKQRRHTNRRKKPVAGESSEKTADATEHPPEPSQDTPAKKAQQVLKSARLLKKTIETLEDDWSQIKVNEPPPKEEK